MKNRLFFKFLSIIWVLVFLLGMVAPAPAPTDKQVKNLRTSLQTIRSGDLTDEKKEAQYAAVLNKAADEFDFSKLTFTQIKQELAKGGVLYAINALRKRVYPALTRLAQKKGLEGVRAASLRTIDFPQSNGSKAEQYKQQLAWAACYKEFIHHSSINEFLLLEGYESSSVFGRLVFLDKKAVGESGLIQEILPLLDKPMSIKAAGAIFVVFNVAADSKTGLSEETVQKVRRKCVKGLQAAMKKNPDNDLLKGRMAYLKGASARGKLIGYKAPNVDINWISEGHEKRLKDFRGNVVVLDFWATWCSPCIASFPNMRKLVERYKGYSVKFIGITSLQGSYLDPKTKKRIDTKGKPKKEYALTTKFMNQMDMTWTVAFTKQDVFNAGFAVTGIPHVAIIDPSGAVRYNELRPTEAPYHEAEKIDALLKASGLPYPKQAMAQKNYSDVE